MPDKIINLSIDEISPVDNPANDEEFLVIKRDDSKEGGESMDFDEVMEKLSEENEELAEVIKDDREQLQSRVEELEKEVKESDSSDEEEGEEEIDKSQLSEEVREKLEKLENKAEINEEMAKKEREKRLKEEFTKKAQKFDEIGDTDKIYNVLRKASEITEKDEDSDFYSDIVSLFKTAQKRISQGDLFKQSGDSGEEIDDAEGELEKRANKLKEQDNDIDTLEKAKSKVLEDNPDLYKAYKQTR